MDYHPGDPPGEPPIMRKLWILPLLVAAAACGAAASRNRLRPSRGYRRRFIRDRRHAHQVERGRRTRGSANVRPQRRDLAMRRGGGRETALARRGPRGRLHAKGHGLLRPHGRGVPQRRGGSRRGDGVCRAWRSRTGNTATTTSLRKTRRAPRAGDSGPASSPPPWEYRQSQRGESNGTRTQQANRRRRSSVSATAPPAPCPERRKVPRSRETSTAKASGSITCRARRRTTRRASIRATASACSAPRRKRGPPAGARRAGARPSADFRHPAARRGRDG